MPPYEGSIYKEGCEPAVAGRPPTITEIATKAVDIAIETEKVIGDIEEKLFGSSAIGLICEDEGSKSIEDLSMKATRKSDDNLKALHRILERI